MIWHPKRASSNRASVLLALAMGACFGGGPPPRTVRLHDVHPGSAHVVFVRGRERRFSPRLSVYDEEGYLLGELPRNSWFVLERPPGAQTFFAASSPGCAHNGTCVAHSDIAALPTNVLPGRVYVVQVRHRIGGSLSVREAWRNESNACPLALLDSLRTEFVEMQRAPPGSPLWSEASRIMQFGRALRAAPQRFEHPVFDGAKVVAGGLTRLQNGCVQESTFIQPEDGGPDWPYGWSPGQP